MNSKTLIYILVGLLAGCALAKTVYVPHGKAVRIRKTVKNAKVWVKTKDGKTIAGKINISEGWYCLPDPGRKTKGAPNGK